MFQKFLNNIKIIFLVFSQLFFIICNHNLADLFSTAMINGYFKKG